MPPTPRSERALPSITVTLTLHTSLDTSQEASQDIEHDSFSAEAWDTMEAQWAQATAAQREMQDEGLI